VQLELLSVSSCRPNRGVHRSTRVHDKQIASIQPTGKIAEPGMLDLVAFEVGDEQTHAIAFEPSRLGGFRRLEFCGQRKRCV
jgi:hypothetical protein